MTRKELEVFKKVSSKLSEAYVILKKVEVKNPTENYAESLEHAKIQVLLADCAINHQLFLKERETF